MTNINEPAEREAALTKALKDAANSLQAIHDLAGRDEYMDTWNQVRAYAENRARVARAALAPESGR